MARLHWVASEIRRRRYPVAFVSVINDPEHFGTVLSKTKETPMEKSRLATAPLGLRPPNAPALGDPPACNDISREMDALHAAVAVLSEIMSEIDARTACVRIPRPAAALEKEPSGDMSALAAVIQGVRLRVEPIISQGRKILGEIQL